MKELVYSTGNQVTPDKDKKANVSKIGIADIVGIATGAISAFAILDKTDLKNIAKKVTDIVKVPWLAAGIVALYIVLGVKADEGTLE